MPWNPADSFKHTKRATSPRLKKLWADVANKSLAEHGDEGRAIREANAAVSKAKATGRVRLV